MDPNDIITMLNFAQKKPSDDLKQSFGSETENSAIKQILNLVQDVRYNQDNQVYQIVFSDSQHFHYSRKKRFFSNVMDHLPIYHCIIQPSIALRGGLSIFMHHGPS